MNRRTLLSISALGLAGGSIAGAIILAPEQSLANDTSDDDTAMNDDLNLDPNPNSVERIELSKAEWKERFERRGFLRTAKRGHRATFYKRTQ